MIYGIDISDYQPDFDLHRAAREGVEFAIIKATEGTGWRGDWFRPHLDRARAAGMLVAAYHYQRPASAAMQVANIRAAVPLDCPVILDVEDGSGSVDLTRSIVSRLRNAGYTVPLTYIPAWFWQQIGRPTLTGLPPLWYSRYANSGGTKEEIWSRNAGWFNQYWGGYGGLPVEVMQYTSSATVAGRWPVDANVYRGTRSDLADLLGGGQEDDMSAEAERMIREMYASVSKMYVRHERDWGDALADMYGWTRPLPIETGPVDPDTGEAPIKWQALNDAVVNVYGQLFFGSNYGAGPAVISQLGKLADGSGIDPEVVRQAVATAVGQANEAFVASIRGEVLAAVGEDNADLADDIVARIGAALAQPEGTL